VTTFERLLDFIVTTIFRQQRAVRSCVNIHVRENWSQVLRQLTLHNLDMERVFEDLLAKSVVSCSGKSVRCHKWLSRKADQRTVR
jgi:hypothetical protein